MFLPKNGIKSFDIFRHSWIFSGNLKLFCIFSERIPGGTLRDKRRRHVRRAGIRKGMGQQFRGLSGPRQAAGRLRLRLKNFEGV